ncbi:MAG TPA: RNA methyltransferase [Pyrinomonadaceae bacterium]|jgi:TrmH family RNA methyltransferase|nr:RNA methyltransferase [Pyrinomonadaceae bacterium]
MKHAAITSRKNPLVQRARAARDGREKERVFVEGIRLCEEALRAGVEFEFVLYTSAFEEGERGVRLVEQLRRTCPHVFEVSESVNEFVSDTKTAQGVVAIAGRPKTGRDVIGLGGETPLVVIMHCANNPANAGAMLRVAEAAGATAVINTKGSTDLFSPKALRGSMGSAFRVPLWTGASLEEALGWCAARGIKTVGAGAGASIRHTEINWTIPRAVLVGPEAAGLSEEELRAADETVHIPMREPVESLNVAVALAVILYEAARQRDFGSAEAGL